MRDARCATSDRRSSPSSSSNKYHEWRTYLLLGLFDGIGGTPVAVASLLPALLLLRERNVQAGRPTNGRGRSQHVGACMGHRGPVQARLRGDTDHRHADDEAGHRIRGYDDGERDGRRMRDKNRAVGEETERSSRWVALGTRVCLFGEAAADVTRPRTIKATSERASERARQTETETDRDHRVSSATRTPSWRPTCPPPSLRSPVLHPRTFEPP